MESIIDSISNVTEYKLSNDDFKFNGIICFGNEIFYHEDLVIENEVELKREHYLLEKFEFTPFYNKFHNQAKQPFILKNTFIYYSNIIDGRGNYSGANMQNISTSASIRNIINHSGLLIDSKTTQFDVFEIEESRRILECILLENNDLKINLNSIVVTIISFSSFNCRYISPENNREMINLIEFYKKIEEKIFNRISDDINKVDDSSSDRINYPIEKRQKWCKKLFQLYILTFFTKFDENPQYQIQIENFILDENEDLNIKNYPSHLNDLFSLHEDLINNATFNEAFYGSPNITESCFDLIKCARLNLSSEKIIEKLGYFIYFEKVLKKNSQNQFKLIANFRLIFSISSGEYSFLIFYIRLKNKIVEINRYRNRYKNIVLFIDEGETGFHPEWQRQYLKRVLDFLTQNFKEHKFQLIFTTHSPYLLSDFPSSNVILLKKNEITGITEIKNTNTFKTFGANIHNLLSDNFFLKSYIGEFSKNKIMALFEYLAEEVEEEKETKENGYSIHGNKNEYRDRDKETILTLINEIGEPILRKELLRLYDRKFSVQNELEEIEREIERLKELIKKKKKENDTD